AGVPVVGVRPMAPVLGCAVDSDCPFTTGGTQTLAEPEVPSNLTLLSSPLPPARAAQAEGLGVRAQGLRPAGSPFRSERCGPLPNPLPRGRGNYSCRFQLSEAQLGSRFWIKAMVPS